MTLEYDGLLKELEEELKFEDKVLTRDQCFGSLTRHNILYEKAKSILNNWHELMLDGCCVKPSEPVYEYLWKLSGIFYGEEVVTCNYRTEEEMGNLPFYKIEESERLRR